MGLPSLCAIPLLVACFLILPGQSSCRAFFSVIKTTSASSGPKAAVTIKYDIISANIGNGFDKHTGHFEAPASGYYFLSMSMMSYSTGKTGLVRMKHNGNTIISAYGRDRAADSNQLIRYLKKGDNVWTELLPSRSIFSNNVGRYVTFSGFIL